MSEMKNVLIDIKKPFFELQLHGMTSDVSVSRNYIVASLHTCSKNSRRVEHKVFCIENSFKRDITASCF